MSGMSGMEIAAIRRLAQDMQRRGDEVDTIRRRASAIIASLPWSGTDRERFVDEWESNHAPRLAKVATGLFDASKAARHSADEQERISRS